MDNKNKIVLYQDENGTTKVSLRFGGEDLWLTQNQIAEIYNTSRPNITMHIQNILKKGELDENLVCKDFLLTATDGKPYNTKHYNLDMIIALSYRVRSQVAIAVRRWAIKRLHEYIQKGFAMDDERLEEGGGRYFRELLQRVRDIRSSERNFYQKVTDIYATSVDYNPHSDTTKKFFAHVQHKVHFALHGRADDEKIAKNYPSKSELQRLNPLLLEFLDFAEFQALEQNPMSMNDWIAILEWQLLALKGQVLVGGGKISHAVKKAEKEFEIYRKREIKQLVKKGY